MPHKLILLDGSAFLFRAYFSTLKQNLNQEGFPTGAMFGVISAIKRLQKQYPEAKLIAIFDAKGKNFRHDIYPQYKAHRKPADEDLIIQIEPLYEIIRAMGLHFLCIPGVEADDVIATLSHYATKHQLKTIIASGDKDLMQLITPTITQLDMNGTHYDRAAVIKKMGVTPEKILDLLALTGDSADNIPGVPSVGPKTAIKWLALYQDLAGVKNNAHEIKGKVGEKLRDNFPLLDLSQQLVKLKFDVKLPCDILDTPPQQDTNKLASLYQQYGFFSWYKQLDNPISSTTPNTIPNTTPNATPTPSQSNTTATTTLISQYSQTTILDQPAFDQLLTRLNTTQNIVFKLKTNSPDYMIANIIGWAFLIESDSFYLPVAHNEVDAPAQLDFDQVMQALTPILENPKLKKIGQNLKYDAHILANHQIDLNGIADDTMLKSYLINSVATRHNIEDLAKHYLNYQPTPYAEIAGKGKKQLTFNQIPVASASTYTCQQLIITDLLNKTLNSQIAQYPKLLKLYQQVELPLLKVLMSMERNGVKLDAQALAIQQTDIKAQMDDIQAQAYQLAGQPFNLESPKQIQQILFSESGLGLVAKKKTPKGAPSTNEEALALLDHPLVTLISSYRTLTKLNATYLIALPKQINTNTQRLHTQYHQAVTATGRLSSANPNLQNIPIRTAQGARIRGAFIADAGKRIIAADYSQIELRIMAHLSQDANLCQAFKHHQDVHSITAATMFNTPIEAVTKAQRRSAKAINFGLIYGMSAFGLAKQINVSRTEAKAYMQAYFEHYPGVADYMQACKQSAKEQGYVQTLMGRRLYLPQINASNKMQQQHALRAAINAPMQGSSADIIKLAMLNIHTWIGTNNPDISMTMQVHDELVFEVVANKAEEFAKTIQTLMESAHPLDIPLKVDIGIGNSWQAAH